jgi:hypothetical protein
MSMEIKRHEAAPGPGAGYETRDANPRSLIHFGLGLFLVLVVVMVGMKWVFDYFGRVQQLGPPATPFEQGRTLPPMPRLQAEPEQDLARLRQQQEEAVDSYGWVDRNRGVVHIPVARAMDLLLERGLPVRPGGPPPDRRGAATPREPAVAAEPAHGSGSIRP